MWCELAPLHVCCLCGVDACCRQTLLYYPLVAPRHFPVEGALEKSVRAAGLPSNFAEHYASEVLKQYPGKPECVCFPPGGTDSQYVPFAECSSGYIGDGQFMSSIITVEGIHWKLVALG